MEDCTPENAQRKTLVSSRIRLAPDVGRVYSSSVTEEKMSEKMLHAVIRDGRYVVDEAAENLPEGKRLKLVVVEDDDEMTKEEQAKLHASIDKGRAQIAAGQRITAEAFLAKLQERSK
jgi:hypothetical protein